MTYATKKKSAENSINVKVSVGFWGSKTVDPYDLLVSKARSGDLSRDKSIKIDTEKK